MRKLDLVCRECRQDLIVWLVEFDDFSECFPCLNCGSRLNFVDEVSEEYVVRKLEYRDLYIYKGKLYCYEIDDSEVGILFSDKFKKRDLERMEIPK